MSTPPRTGPRIGPSVTTAPTMPIIFPARAGPAARASMVSRVGSSAPTPMPCTTRNAMRLAGSHATAASAEPSRKTVSPTSHTVLPPKRSAAQPLTGTVTATASR